MIGQAFAPQTDSFTGFDMKTKMPRKGNSRLDRESIIALQRIDIFDAVWSGALSTSFAPKSASGSNTASLRLVNSLQHRVLGTVASDELLATMNIEQARTLFLCNLSLVQEKLRDMPSKDSRAQFEIPVDAAALATLGGELRIIAQHTPDLFKRVQVTHSEEDLAALSSIQIEQLKALEALGLRLNTRRSAGARTGSDSHMDTRLHPSMISSSTFRAHATM